VTREEAVASLSGLSALQDTEQAHRWADEILCEVLVGLRYGDVVEAWLGVSKWYA
jgi:hypothetical protein